MSDGSESNDNARDPAAPAPEPLTLEHEIAHAILQLALHERSIKRLVMCSYPDGRREALGELLVRLGVYVHEKEIPTPKSRLVLPSHLR